MKVRKVIASAAACAVALLVVVGGFLTRTAEARVSNKPSLSSGQFRSWFFSATVAIPYMQSGDSGNDPAVFEPTDVNRPVGGTVVLGFSVWAATAGATASVYDADQIQDISTAALSRTLFIDEIGEATQYDTVYSDWPAPRKLDTGLCIITDRAPCVVTVFME